MLFSEVIIGLGVVASWGLAGGLAVRERWSWVTGALVVGLVLVGIEGVIVILGFRELDPAVQRVWWLARLWLMGLGGAAWLVLGWAFGGGQAGVPAFGKRLLIAGMSIPTVVLCGGLAGWWELIVLRDYYGVPLPALGLWGKGLLFWKIAAAVVTLACLERVMKAAVGTQRWRVKYVVLGVGALMAISIYASLQHVVLFAGDVEVEIIYFCGVILACGLLAIGGTRAGAFLQEIYPSSKLLGQSVTLFMCGVYLVVVGLLAKLGGAFLDQYAFAIQSVLVMAALIVLAIAVGSDRIRLRVREFVEVHLRRPVYDVRRLWIDFTDRLSGQGTVQGVCTTVADYVAKTFQVLSVTVWIRDEQADGMKIAASTESGVAADLEERVVPHPPDALFRAWVRAPDLINVRSIDDPWGRAWEAKNPVHFQVARKQQVLVPLVAKEELMGIVSLCDRVRGKPYSHEEGDLLRGVGQHAAAALLNVDQASKRAASKELEAFQEMATFFVHDLKNAASSLSVMLKNFSVHLDKPEFRRDAERSIARAVGRINGLVDKLALLRAGEKGRYAAGDLVVVVRRALEHLALRPGVEVETRLASTPPILMDASRIEAVVTNLVMNAQDAIRGEGRIEVSIAWVGGHAVLTIRDTGVGMTHEFIEKSLFRPFKTTKPKGMGIGMYQCKCIVEDHGGTIRLTSRVDVGTEVSVWLPLAPASDAPGKDPT